MSLPRVRIVIVTFCFMKVLTAGAYLESTDRISSTTYLKSKR